MIKISIIQYINLDDAMDHFGTNFHDYNFCQEAENESYVPFYLDDDAYQGLKEEIEWEEGKCSFRLARLRNDLDLMLYLRAMGFRDTILVYVSW